MPQLGVVDVALHLDRCDRALGDASVGERCRVARVLPATAPPTDGARRQNSTKPSPSRSPERRSSERPRIAGCSSGRAARRVSSARARRAGSGTAASHRPCRSSGERRPRRPPAPQLVDDLARLGVDFGIVRRRLQVGERAQRRLRELGPEEQRLQARDQVSRPKTVMNHGMPAAGSRPTPSLPRMRSAARSATERE